MKLKLKLMAAAIALVAASGANAAIDNMASGNSSTSSLDNQMAYVCSAPMADTGITTVFHIGTAYQLTFYENAMYQNYLAVTGTGTGSVPAIPEADNYALLLAGLGLMGFVARRRLRD